MTTDADVAVTGGLFLAAAAMLWLGWAFLPVRIGAFFQPNDFGAVRSGPRIVDSVLSEISTGFQAAVFTATCSKYTASGVRRSSAV